MKKFTKKQHDLRVALSERGATWDNLEDRPYDICIFEGVIWTHDKKSDRIATAWCVGGMEAEPDFDMSLGKSPFNKNFADKYMAKKKEAEKEVVKLLKLFRLHVSNAPVFEEVSYSIKDGAIRLWEENNIDSVEVGKYKVVHFDGGYDPLVVKFSNFTKVVKHVNSRKKFSKTRRLLWAAIFEYSEDHKLKES